MDNSFLITTPSNSVLLNSTLQGHAVFTVTNISGRINRGRVRAVAKNTVASGWITLEGENERDFAIAGTQQFSVAIAVPPTAPPGSYMFDLEVVGVENPDEDLAQGPTVTFEVPIQPKRKFPWWIVIAAGVVLLVIIGILIAVLSPKPLAIPDVSGITQAAAERQLVAAGFKVQGVTFQPSSAIPNNLVLGTDPAAGTKVDPGSALTLIVSSGPQATATPTITPTAVFTNTPIPTVTPTVTPPIAPPPTGLLAHYPLINNPNDITNQMAPITLVNAPFNPGGVFCNGVYENSGNPNFCKILTPQLTGFNFNSFSISVRFRPAEKKYMPVFVGGNSFRWIGFLLLENGHVALLYNNNNTVDCGLSYTPGTFYGAMVTYDGSTAKLYLDNIQACSKSFTLVNGGDANVGSTNYSNASTFFGTFGDLRIYRTVITP